jgi:hypothetical protein
VNDVLAITFPVQTIGISQDLDLVFHGALMKRGSGKTKDSKIYGTAI